jgi:hypothetical protein
MIAILSFVMRGLDPRIHAECHWREVQWIAGSSPAMTNCVALHAR